jgi:transposase-like protein
MDFKAKVVLEVLKERESLEALSKRYELHPSQLSAWKQEVMSNFSKVFVKESSTTKEKDKGLEIKRLYQMIGEQKMEIEYLKKNV